MIWSDDSSVIDLIVSTITQLKNIWGLVFWSILYVTAEQMDLLIKRWNCDPCDLYQDLGKEHDVRERVQTWTLGVYYYFQWIFTVLFKHLRSNCCFICRPLISSTETQILVTTLGIRHWAKSTLTSTGWIETLVPLRPGSKQTLRDQMTRQKSREERKEFTEQLMRNYLIMQALKVSITI